MKIGLMGFDFMSPNKGCEALTYSFVNMLIECFGEDIMIKNYSYGELGILPQIYPKVNFEIRRPKVKSIIDMWKMREEMTNLDIIFDVTFGDGFSDIYGKMWNIATNLSKQVAILSGKPVVLLPQTYGPYQNKLLKYWATNIIKRSAVCYSRDTASAVEMNKYCSGKVKILTDMAFALPYDKELYFVDHSQKCVGINVSALLWDSEYAKENKFELRVEYKNYIKAIIDHLITDGKYVVHLIPHVVDLREYNAAENDVRACDEVKRMYKNCDRVIVAPAFKTPIEAKSYIANMDVFLGARMHATIGALSAGVATIPFAYSKKFKTMFGNLNYNYVLEARDFDTQAAIDQTIEWINKVDELTEHALQARNKTNEKLAVLKQKMIDLSRQ